MNRPEMPKYKTSRIIVGVVIALAAALLTPLMIAFSTTVVAFTLINAILFSACGMPVAIFAAMLDVLALGVVFGIPGALVGALAVALPTAVIIRNVYWRRDFRLQLTQAVASQLIGILGALVVARLFIGEDLIGALVAQMRSLTDMIQPGIIDFALDQIYKIDAVPDTIDMAQLETGILEPSVRAKYLDGYMSELSASLRLMLPGYLLSSACLTGVLSAAFSAKILDKRIPMPGSYISLGRWYTPWQISLGVLGTWVVAWLLTLLGVESGDVLQVTLYQLMALVYRIQAAASLERHLIRANMRPVGRVLIILGFQLLLPIQIIIYYGAFSALFGSTGASMQLQMRRTNKNKDK